VLDGASINVVPFHTRNGNLQLPTFTQSGTKILLVDKVQIAQPKDALFPINVSRHINI
jgi:hypothetical protein